ncbi:MAG: hypothetical protein IK093_16075 [Ruminiclostridium sp.]|nr:hypothetical protein [Ruminiclostridium sp.]
MPDEIAQRLADIIDNAAESLFNALQCCYLIADENFYNVNVKDVFRIGLSNLTDPDCFRNLGFDLEKDKLGELGSEKFKEVLEIIRYCFATRIPFARRDAPECNIKDNQIRQMYDILEEYGFANPDGIVVESFKSVSWLARTKKPEPQFDTEWFRSWIYTYGHETAAINNRNMFLLGCADALFPLYYSALKERLVEEFNKYGAA